MKCIITIIVLFTINVFAMAQKDSIVMHGCDTTYVYYEVVNPKTGRVWLDRNLGAYRVATSPTDHLAYGNRYQWGRASDGHECMKWVSGTSGKGKYGTTSTLSSSDTTGHNLFITISLLPENWRKPANKNLWKGLDGMNNPCPQGFRLPTKAEWDEERLSWSANNATGAYESVLKLPKGGARSNDNGSMFNVGGSGHCWAQDFLINASAGIIFNNSSWTGTSSPAYGFCVRCIKDISTGIQSLEEEKELKLFPNPARYSITLEVGAGSEIYYVEILSLIGSVIITEYVDSRKSVEINVADLEPGLYILRIHGDKSNRVFKFVKK